MTTKEHIDLIVERQYGGYRGRLMQPLKELHRKTRILVGDNKFLEILKKSEKENPRPKYEIPQSVRDALNSL